ncbi:hypothetical protein BGZ60DRAFT_556984 [Tricladium varicosporioides]|nr:hypothetical protein BGZ60DRAFT_556984 [Hymenoscyphus varicosporioides]
MNTQNPQFTRIISNMDRNASLMNIYETEDSAQSPPSYSSPFTENLQIEPMDNQTWLNMTINDGIAVSLPPLLDDFYTKQKKGNSIPASQGPQADLLGQLSRLSPLPLVEQELEPKFYRPLFEQDKQAAEKAYDDAVIRHFNQLESALQSQLQLSQIVARAMVDPLFVSMIRDIHNDDWITRRTEWILDKETEQLRDFANSEHASTASSSTIPLPILPAILAKTHPLNEFLKIMKPDEPCFIDDISALIFLLKNRDFLRCYCIYRARVIEFERNKKEREGKRIKRKRRDDNTRARKRLRVAAEAKLEKEPALQTSD